MGFTYHEAVQRLLWLGHEGRSLKWDLNNIRAVLERLGRPEQRLRTIHIAGTNGKGSVAAMIAAILRCAGYRAGLYTSPHLVRMNERIQVDATAIADADFAAAFDALDGAVEGLLAENALPNYPSYFECLTAMALWHFARAGVEVAVLEVGLGGRLDATNVVTPEISVITSIDFDHERYLGHSIEQIASEKAGIIKPGVPVINAAAHSVARAVVARRTAEIGAPLVDVESAYRGEIVRHHDFGRYQFVVRTSDGLSLPLAPRLRGAFQVENALVAVATARTLAARGWKLSEEAIATGIARAEWRGRLELLRHEPLVFFDGAHNPAGARQVLRFWQEHVPGRHIHLVYGTLRDKAVEEVAEQLFPAAASIVVTQPSTPRAASAELIARLARLQQSRVVVEPDPCRALALALAQAAAEDVVFVTGSLFLVGDCLQAWETIARAPQLAGSQMPAT